MIEESFPDINRAAVIVKIKKLFIDGGWWGGASKNCNYLRKTKHTHNSVDDAKGNAEAFLEMIKQYDLKVQL